MLIYSFRLTKAKILGLCFLVAALGIITVYAVTGRSETAASDGAICYKAESAAERLAFISQYGWEVEEDPAEVAEVIIPAEFDETYTAYNAIQQKMGLDLSPYKSLRAKRWSYSVKNYPGYEGQKGVVELNLLIYNGRVIGGDVCSLEKGGFLQGFERPKLPEESTTASAKSSTTATESAQKTTVKNKE